MSSSVLKSKFTELSPLKDNEKTLPEYFLAKTKRYAEQGKDVWLIDGITDEKRHFANFEVETRRIASALYKLGLRQGGVVIYMVRDLFTTPLLLTGVWRANGIIRSSYPDDDAETILDRVKESQCNIIVCEEDAIELCKGVANNAGWDLKVVSVNRSKSCSYSLQQIIEEDAGDECPELTVKEDDPAIILCTSGTTGLPKGAVHTHKTFLYDIRSLERFPFTSHKPNLVATKATHLSGTTFCLIILACGKTGVVVSNLTKENIFNAATKYKPGLAFAFPTFLVAMAGPDAEGHDFSSIEVILTGGVPITPAIRKSLMQLPNLKDIVTAYGLTEVMICTTTAILKEDDERETPGIRDLPDFSVGKVYPGTELQVRDVDTHKVLGANERGEICVTSHGLFHSYLNNPEATQNAYVDGYFRTGDIGYYDENGFVFVVDRLKEIFKYYNDHISPTEIEDVIGKHPKVGEVCVVGAADPGGHVPRAFVRVHPNSGDRADVAQEIKEYANGKLAPYKHLRGGVYIVDELPKGKTGKITRQLVEKLPIV